MPSIFDMSIDFWAWVEEEEIKMTDDINSLAQKRLFTLKEAARLLGRSVWGVRELIWRGLLPVVRTHTRGKQWIDVKDLESFIERNKFQELSQGGNRKDDHPH